MPKTKNDLLKPNQLPHHDVLTKHGYKYEGTNELPHVIGKPSKNQPLFAQAHAYKHPSGDKVSVNHFWHLGPNAIEITHAGTQHKHGTTHVGPDQSVNWVHTPADWLERTKGGNNPHTGGLSATQLNRHLNKQKTKTENAEAKLSRFFGQKLSEQIESLVESETKPQRMVSEAVRQTACRHCGQDIETFHPYRKGEWRDRGNNTHCPNDSGKLHAPVIERKTGLSDGKRS